MHSITIVGIIIRKCFSTKSRFRGLSEVCAKSNLPFADESFERIVHMAVLMFILYTILGAIGLILAFLLLRVVVNAIWQFVRIVPDYLWHTIVIVLYVAAFVGAIIWAISIF